MRIGMVGAGYVGLVSGACFSEFGHSVVCVDTDKAKVAALCRGEIPIFEPGLKEVVASNVRAGRLSFGTELRDAVQDCEAVFIAVGTPSRRGDGHADLTYVFDAAAQVAKAIRDYTVVVTKSTVPVGTSKEVRELIASLTNTEFDVVSNPEFLREGSAVADFMRPDRVVVGAATERARSVMREIYRPLYLNETPIVFTTPQSAELIKYAANAFLATKITFINEIANLCEKTDADVQDVARAIGLDKRIGGKFLHAGPGYGRSCFPKDTLALKKTARDLGCPVHLIETVVAVNEERKLQMAEKIETAFGGLAGKTVAVLGLTFKPNTDDMRDAPSLAIVPKLLAEGAKVRAFDPEGAGEARKILDIEICANSYDTVQGADGLVILTEWNEFRALDLARTKSLLKHPLIVDLRNIYNPAEVRAAGFHYVSVGRT